jgi:hypothetical protein
MRSSSAKGSCKPLSPSTACRGYADPARPVGIGRARSPNGPINWPQAELEESERRTRQQAANRTVIRPSAAEITHMEMAFEWLSELRVEDSGMALVTTLWALRTARGRSIKKLCAGAAYFLSQAGQGLGKFGGGAQRARRAGFLGVTSIHFARQPTPLARGAHLKASH